MNTIILITIAWLFIGIFYQSKFKYRTIQRGLAEEWSYGLIAEKASEGKWNFLLGPICFVNYCLDFGSGREGYANPFGSEKKLFDKLVNGWRPKSFLCYFGIHHYYEKRSVFNTRITQGKLPKEIKLHTTEQCMYCSKSGTENSSHVLEIDGEYVLLKSKALNPVLVERIYTLDNDGKSANVIAKELNISKTTVHKYLDIKNSN